MKKYDHLGNEFSSICKMCEYWGVGRSTFNARCKAGYTLEQCLTGEGIVPNKSIVPNRSKACTDHLGNQFKSVSEMCRHWGIEVNKFNKRYSAGYSIEQCLTGGEVKSTKKECTDHLGNQFESVAEMCRHWGVSYDLFRSRCSAGYTLEQSLTGEGINRHTSSKKCTDHLGNHFKSVSEMCSHWGVTKYAFITRSKAGYTLEQCLTGKDVNKAAGNKKPCKDHLGNQFESIAAMTRHWGITQNDFYNRCRAGYTLEQCLTGKGIK